MLKNKTQEMEWARMEENEWHKRSVFRVFKTYKSSLLIGFGLGISLVMGVGLVGQVVGKENNPSVIVTEGADRQQPEVEVAQNDGQQVESSTTTNDSKVSENSPLNSANDTSADSSPNSGPDNLAVPPADEPDSTFDKKHFTVLLVGVDRRAGEKSLSNTDTLLLASINTDNGKVALLSIPRDTQVTIPGYGKEKINAAARLGKGLKTTEALITGLTGQPIDGYVLTNFSGFKSIIDTLGGISINVEKNMYYQTGDKEDGLINLHKGTQRLNGKQALQYARFRQDALGDITRTTRQQAVIKAMEREFLQVRTVPKLPVLIPQMAKAVETNLSLGQLWSVANLLLRFDQLDVISQTLPGNFLIENEISYWKVNPQKSKVVVRRLLEEGKTTSVFFNNDGNMNGS